MKDQDTITTNQFQLLKQRRFAPLFWTQFFGGFNDNIFRNTLVVLVVFKSVQLGLSPAQVKILPNLFAALFIFPYFLFSAFAGQLADKYEKSHLIRYLKAWEIGIAIIASVGVCTDNLVLLCVTLFFLGLQATAFGPVKYSILPQALAEKELIGGNALVEMGTFVAILVGTIAGGLLIMIDPAGKVYASGAMIAVALCGFASCWFIPKTRRDDPDMKLNWNIFTGTWDLMKYAAKDRSVFWCVIALSWFWFYGVLFLTQIAAYTKDYIGGNDSVNVLILSLFSIGVGIGSMLCERLSKHRIELGLVPLGAFGITLFVCIWYFVSPGEHHGALIGIGQFLSEPRSWFVMMCLLGMTICAGIFTVPMYAYIQHKTHEKYRSRIIAANNIFNAIYMVLASGFAMLVFKLGFSIPQLFFIVGIMNLIYCVWIFKKVPEFMQRFKILFLRPEGKRVP
tara:strand:+ start:27418 stop:28773 length:1356 start_codon:yes stop_codon:yes gene_type:complete